MQATVAFYRDKYVRSRAHASNRLYQVLLWFIRVCACAFTRIRNRIKYSTADHYEINIPANTESSTCGRLFLWSRDIGIKWFRHILFTAWTRSSTYKYLCYVENILYTRMYVCALKVPECHYILVGKKLFRHDANEFKMYILWKTDGRRIRA